MSDRRPIGVFDSGLGGLTVVKEIRKVLPSEDIVYFGDLARVPYGNKSEETVMRYAIESCLFLLKQDVKMIVVACNTASAVAVEKLDSIFSVPIVGMIAPVINSLRNYHIKRLAVIGTQRTIKTEIYPRKIRQVLPHIEIYSMACPLFVPMIESGIVEGKLCEDIVKFHLGDVCRFFPDVVILGCTHYPVIENIIRHVVNSEVVCCSNSASSEVKRVLEAYNMLSDSSNVGELVINVSDITESLEDMIKLFLNSDADFNVRRVDTNVLC